jgi:tetratricopeptide (TPR) repeat protein
VPPCRHGWRRETPFRASQGGRPTGCRKCPLAATDGGAKRRLAPRKGAVRPALELHLAQNPADGEIRRELARQYLRAFDLAGAERTQSPLALATDPLPLAEDLALWGDIQLAQGRLRGFSSAYEAALACATGSVANVLERRWADALVAAGDFAQALIVFDRLSAKTPSDLDLGLARAWCLASAERYGEARQECAVQRLAYPREPRLDQLEARICLLEKNFPAAFALVPCSEDVASPLAIDARLIRAEAFLALDRSASAAAELGPIDVSGPLDEPHPIERLGNLHRLLGLTGLATAAERLLTRLEEQRPFHPDLRLFRLMGHDDRPAVLQAAILEDRRVPPRHLARWGEILAGLGDFESAAVAFRQALLRQPDCLPASLGLAMLLATTERFDEASAVLAPIAREFPTHSVVQLWRARLLAWARRDEEARAAYRRLMVAHPEDPVPQREAARLAFWRKRLGEAKALYCRHPRPPADLQIAHRLASAGLSLAAGDALGSALGNALERSPDWDGWDRLDLVLTDPPFLGFPDRSGAMGRHSGRNTRGRPAAENV